MEREKLGRNGYRQLPKSSIISSRELLATASIGHRYRTSTKQPRSCLTHAKAPAVRRTQKKSAAKVNHPSSTTYLNENVAEDPELATKAWLQLDHADTPAAAHRVVLSPQDELVRGV